ncbi:MAG: tRNA (N6-threonylcarbamoyladenosine(37)-N6)-methyltransferase TrmO [Thermoproteota archaeon]
MQKVEMEPIGIVKVEEIGEDHKDGISHLILREELVPALKGIEDFSHLWVIFWMHKVSEEDRRTLKVRPRGRADMPLLGVFSTRTPHRSNPIGLTKVRLLKVEDNILTVEDLDALHNTPVLDLKPYDYWDRNETAKVPHWWRKMEKERKSTESTT